MSTMMNALGRLSRAGFVAPLLLALALFAQAAPAENTGPSGRAVALDIEAEVIAVDLQTREVTLRGAMGLETTLVAPEKVIKLEDVKVGDRVKGTYYVGIEGEVRAPTAEELADPWVVLEGKSVSGDSETPGIDAARLIRAVVTIESLNPEKGFAIVKDSRGKQHFIGSVEPAKMAGVKVGQKAVIVFTEAMALTLEKQAKPAQ